MKLDKNQTDDVLYALDVAIRRQKQYIRRVQRKRIIPVVKVATLDNEFKILAYLEMLSKALDES